MLKAAKVLERFIGSRIVPRIPIVPLQQLFQFLCTKSGGIHRDMLRVNRFSAPKRRLSASCGLIPVAKSNPARNSANITPDKTFPLLLSIKSVEEGDVDYFEVEDETYQLVMVHPPTPRLACKVDAGSRRGSSMLPVTSWIQCNTTSGFLSTLARLGKQRRSDL